jgi:hypothetical protein
MTTGELKEILGDAERFRSQAFETLREIARVHGIAEESGDPAEIDVARQLVIRALERREEMGTAKPVHDALLARVGLFPYLDNPDTLGLGDRLALEAHRPLVQPRDEFVFHSTQAQVYARLMDGETVILTAPTSFGKTLIVDALVVSGRYAHVVVVVPTIALIDEVRRRLSRLNDRYGLGFKIITHPGQSQGDRNIYVMTQERALEEPDFPALDLVVIDEMYKLSLDQDPQRGQLLNQALYKLRKISKQLYLLGPNVGRLAELPADFEHTFIPSDDSTVAVDVSVVDRTDDERRDLLELCARLSEPTLIFVKSPARANQVAGWLAAASLGGGSASDAAEWLSDNYHPAWILPISMRAGIGVHHGQVPRAIAHHVVSEFNDGNLRFLVCTSTLIEGVNTTAKNIVILDDKINRSKYDLFTFKNIQGRSGRMFKHFVGRVFLFNPPPTDPLPEIDIPVLSQSSDAPIDLLLSMSPEDLSEDSKERVEPYYDQKLLPIEVLRENSSVDIEAQLKLAEDLTSNLEFWNAKLVWNGFPTYDQRVTVAEIMFNYFGPSARRWGVKSAPQLALFLGRASTEDSLRGLIEEQLAFPGNKDREIDDVVLDVLRFQRSGLTFGFPKHLRAIDRIQRAVFEAASRPTGNYSQYAAASEGSFLPSPLSALDEYGLPLEIVRKLRSKLLPHGPDALDAVLERLRGLSVSQLDLTDFENRLLRESRLDL